MAEYDPNDEFDEEGGKRPFRKRFADWVAKARVVLYTVLVLFLLLLGFLWPRMFITIPAGHQGILFLFFGGGTQTEGRRGEGLNVILPWNAIFIYETRLQQQTLSFDVLSKEGLALTAKVSVRYRPRQDMLGHLHKDIGPEYFDRLIKPEIQSHVRRTFGSRAAVEIYTSALDLMQEITRIPVLGRLEVSQDEGSPRPYVVLQELKLMDIELPEVVVGAIADKYRQEQLMLEYLYKLQREEKEAERKRTEAAGIRDYNSIADKINPDLLRWRGVDATLELAKSQNAKVIVLGGGSGQGGIPVLMNLVDSTANPPAAPAAPAAQAPAQPAAGQPAPAGAPAAQPPPPGPAGPAGQ